ncbi:MAG: GatB/YqeY domain-containing protein [Chloroflexi bacterium]|nr:GatB/YqeY domain-containing protein [Chloroflexota bacterium]
MSLQEKLAADLKEAMRTGDETRKSALRLVRAAIKNAEVARGAGTVLDDAGVQEVIARQVRERRESIAEFLKGNRPELAAQEEAQLQVLLGYLPQQLSRAEIVAEAHQVIAEVGARGPADKGRVMPVIIGRLRGRADGRVVNEVVTELLAAG